MNEITIDIGDGGIERLKVELAKHDIPEDQQQRLIAKFEAQLAKREALSKMNRAARRARKKANRRK